MSVPSGGYNPAGGEQLLFMRLSRWRLSLFNQGGVSAQLRANKQERGSVSAAAANRVFKERRDDASAQRTADE